MIRSMTAFASAEREAAFGTLAIELRSVNHRYLELGLRLPEELRALEPAIRERVAAKISRGKVDLGLRYKPVGGSKAMVLDDAAVDRLADAATRLAAKFPAMRVDFTSLLLVPGVIVQDEIDQDALRDAALAVVDEGIADMVAAREREGEKLAGFLRERLDGIASICVSVRGWLPEIRSALRERMDTRLADLKQPLDLGRLEQEVVLQSQRIDVDEELDRLTAHIAEAHRILGLKEAVGRRLDFLMQEFNRESNTLGSKSIDSRTTQAAVELKVLIEQMREQVQNLE